MNIHCYIFTELQKIMVLMSLLLVYRCVFEQSDFEYFSTNRMMQKFFETFINIVLTFKERAQWFERERKIENYLLGIRHYIIHHFLLIMVF